eukprot:366260-Chlamydomonas_euryale.AAC.15
MDSHFNIATACVFSAAADIVFQRQCAPGLPAAIKQYLVVYVPTHRYPVYLCCLYGSSEDTFMCALAMPHI